MNSIHLEKPVIGLPLCDGSTTRLCEAVLFSFLDRLFSILFSETKGKIKVHLKRSNKNAIFDASH